MVLTIWAMQSIKLGTCLKQIPNACPTVNSATNIGGRKVG